MNPQQLVEQFGAEAILVIAQTLFSMQPQELQEFLTMLEELLQEEQGGQPMPQEQMPSGSQNLFGAQ